MWIPTRLADSEERAIGIAASYSMKDFTRMKARRRTVPRLAG